MYTTCRVYSDAKELADLIVANKNEIESILRSVTGFQAYYLVRTEDGFVSITVCDNQAGAEESNQRAADWVRAHAGGMSGTKPTYLAGSTAIAITSGKAAVKV